jgi:hypothetical protein
MSIGASALVAAAIVVIPASPALATNLGITAVSPSSGTTAGGDVLTITGTGFDDVTDAFVGGAPCVLVNIVSDTDLECTTPAHSAGAAAIQLDDSNGAMALVGGDFTFLDQPQVSTVTPASGPTAGGATIVIGGGDFTDASSVTVGGTPCANYSIDSTTQITCTTPAGIAGLTGVSVTTPGGSDTYNSSYTYVASPTVTSAAPSAGPTAGGTALTVTGTNLTGATAVTVGGSGCTGVSVTSSTSLTCTSPSGVPGAANVVVTTPGGSGTGTGAFTYVAAPTITSISPTSGPVMGGTAVTITGTNLSNPSDVKIGGLTCTGYSASSSTSATCNTAGGSLGPANVVYKTAGGTATGTGLYTFLAGPTISGVFPGAVPPTGGTRVTVVGSGFTGATGVTIGGQACTALSVTSNTELSCTAPAGAAGSANVVVTAPGGTVTGTNMVLYYLPQPPPATPTSTPTPTASPTPTPSTSTQPPTQTPPPTQAPPTQTLPPTQTPPTQPALPAPTVDLKLNLQAGQPVTSGQATLSGDGLHPRSAYSLVMHSTPVVLASGYTDDNGSFDAKLVLPRKACVPAGQHEIVLTAVAPDGSLVHDSSWVVLGDGCAAATAPSSKPVAGPINVATVHFLYNSVGLTPYVRGVLKKSVATLRAGKQVTIAGYTETDKKGAAAARANRALSLKRARVVSAYLHALGLRVPVTVLGLGGVNPVKGKPQSFNRRVVITVRY